MGGVDGKTEGVKEKMRREGETKRGESGGGDKWRAEREQSMSATEAMR